ncbi:MAG: ATP-binding cassette domain-containing protein [Bacteroidetes bacterium]|nr:ATP-binding cassette domain-containing protein [Bacteroidota bacterium]
MASRRGRLASKDEDEMPKARLNRDAVRKAQRLFGYFGEKKIHFYIGLVFLAATGATAIVFPGMLGELMGLISGSEDTKAALDSAEKLKDTFLTQTQADQLLKAANGVGLQLLILFALQAVASYFRVVLFAQATENLLANLRRNTFGKLLKMPMAYFSAKQAAELNSRISADITQIGDTLATGLAELLRQTIVVTGGIIMICLYSWKMSLVMLAIIPPVAIIAVVFARRIRTYSRNLQDRIAESNVIVGESLTGIANVKSFTNEAYEAGRYHRSTDSIITQAINYARFRGLFFSFIIFVLFGAIMLLVWYGVRLAVQQEISAGDLLAFMMYTLFVAASISGLPEQFAQVQRAVGASERIFEIIDSENEPVNDTPGRKRGQLKLNGAVQLSNIHFAYPTRPDFPVLKGVNFTAEPGQTIAIVGSSGSGKSTIAQLLLRFYTPDSGELIIDGKSSAEYDLTALRENMAIVPQDVLLFAGTIRENIAYGRPDASDEEITEAARKANALTFIESFPEGFNTKVGDRGIQLSGGQRQRIAIARAVLKNPRILILDEATSSLDSESERVVQEAIDKLMIGRTSFVIAHRLSTIRNAHKIVVIDKGVVAETGTHDELMAIENGIYKHLSKMQFSGEFTTSES